MKLNIKYVVSAGEMTFGTFDTIKEAVAQVKATLSQLPVGAQIAIVKHFSGEKILRAYQVSETATKALVKAA